MADFIKESKQLKIEIRENEAKYISGELDLIPTLEKTEKLYIQAMSSATKNENTASRVLQDSSLIQLQTKIARQCAKSYKFDSLVFNPVSFSEKVRNHFLPNFSNNDKSAVDEVWEKLGDYSKQYMSTVPTFNFSYGTFDAEPVEPIQRKRKQAIKDKIGDVTKADKVNIDGAKNDSDVMLDDAIRVYSFFLRLVVKTETGALCFYEFVTDPNSFARTVENIFLVSLLVKMGHIYMFEDQHGLPCLKSLTDGERQNWSEEEDKQTVVSITQQDWKDIVKTFKIKTPLILPKKKQVAE